MKDAKGHGSDPKGGMSIDEMIAASGEYKSSTLKDDPSYYRDARAAWSGPAHQEGVQQVGQPPTWSGFHNGPLDPSHQHFDIYVDHGYGTRRLGNDPVGTIGAKNLSDARAAWMRIGSPSQTAKFRLSRRK